MGETIIADLLILAEKLYGVIHSVIILKMGARVKQIRFFLLCRKHLSCYSLDNRNFNKPWIKRIRLIVFLLISIISG